MGKQHQQQLEQSLVRILQQTFLDFLVGQTFISPNFLIRQFLHFGQCIHVLLDYLVGHLFEFHLA